MSAIARSSAINVINDVALAWAFVGAGGRTGVLVLELDLGRLATLDARVGGQG